MTKSLFLKALTLLVYCCGEDRISREITLTNQISIPRLGLGTAGLRQDTYNIVTFALSAAGAQLVDTAQAAEWYDEENVGRAIADYKAIDKDVRIVTVTKIHPRDFRKDHMEKALETSKSRFQSEMDVPLDIVLLHSPWCWTGHCTKEQESHTWQAAWRNLESLKERGFVASIGVSNFDIDLLQELLLMADSKVGVIQNCMDPFHQDREVRELARMEGIVYIAYSSFGTQWEDTLQGFNPVFESQTLQRIADKHSTTISQVVLSWLLQENVVAIPRSSDPKHVIDNFRLLQGSRTGTISVFLDDNDITAIRSLDGTLGSLWGKL